MVEKVKYRCSKCGHSEPVNQKLYWLNQVCSGFIMGLATIGVITLYFVGLVGVDPFMSVVLNQNYERVNAAQDAQLRSIAINWTRYCDGDDSACYAEQLFQHVKFSRYIPDSIYGNHTYDPLTVLREGGDCKGLSNAYVALLKSVGIRAVISSSLSERHAIAVIPRFNRGSRLSGSYVVDLTVPIALWVPDGVDPWRLYEAGFPSSVNNTALANNMSIKILEW